MIINVYIARILNLLFIFNKQNTIRFESVYEADVINYDNSFERKMILVLYVFTIKEMLLSALLNVKLTLFLILSLIILCFWILFGRYGALSLFIIFLNGAGTNIYIYQSTYTYSYIDLIICICLDTDARWRRN